MTQSTAVLDEKEVARVRNTDVFKREWLLNILNGMQANYSGSHADTVSKTLTNSKIDNYKELLKQVVDEYKKEAQAWMAENKPKSFNDYATYLSSTKASVIGHHYARMLGMILAQVKNAYPNDVQLSDNNALNNNLLKGLDVIQPPTLKASMYKFIIPPSKFSIGNAFVDINKYLSAWKTNECFVGTNKRIFDGGSGPNRNNRFIGELGPIAQASTLNKVLDAKRDIQFITAGYELCQQLLKDMVHFQVALNTMPPELQKEVQQAYLFRFFGNQMKPLERAGVPIAKAAELVNVMKQVALAMLANKKPEECLAALSTPKANKSSQAVMAVGLAGAGASVGAQASTAVMAAATTILSATAAVEPASPTDSPRSRSAAIEGPDESRSRSNTDSPVVSVAVDEVKITDVISALQDPSRKEQMKDQVLNNSVAIVFDPDKDFIAEAAKLTKVDPEALQALTRLFKEELLAARERDFADPKSFGL